MPSQDLHGIVVTLPTGVEVQNAIDEMYIQNKFADAYSSWFRKIG